MGRQYTQQQWEQGGVLLSSSCLQIAVRCVACLGVGSALAGHGCDKPQRMQGWIHHMLRVLHSVDAARQSSQGLCISTLQNSTSTCRQQLRVCSLFQLTHGQTPSVTVSQGAAAPASSSLACTLMQHYKQQNAAECMLLTLSYAASSCRR